MTLIRSAHPSEVEEIASMWHDGWRDAHLAIVPDALTQFRTPARFLKRTLAAVGRMIVAADESGIVGMALLCGDELEQFYVAARARGTGLASRLIGAAEARIAEAGHATAWLACSTGNNRARRFYEKQGWEVAREEPFPIPAPDGDIVISVWRMEKPLAAAQPSPPR